LEDMKISYSILDHPLRLVSHFLVRIWDLVLVLLRVPQWM